MSAGLEQACQVCRFEWEGVLIESSYWPVKYSITAHLEVQSITPLRARLPFTPDSDPAPENKIYTHITAINFKSVVLPCENYWEGLYLDVFIIPRNVNAPNPNNVVSDISNQLSYTVHYRLTGKIVGGRKSRPRRKLDKYDDMEKRNYDDGMQVFLNQMSMDFSNYLKQLPFADRQECIRLSE